MVVGDKKFGVVSYVLVGGSGGILPQKIVLYFSTPRTQNRYWTRSVTQTIFCPKFYEC